MSRWVLTPAMWAPCWPSGDWWMRSPTRSWDTCPTAWQRVGAAAAVYLSGGIFAGLFFSALWLCPRGLTSTGYLTWFIAASLLYYMMLSLFCVPWYALGYELAPNYDERTRLMAFPSILGPVGQIFVSWLFPLTQLPIFTDTIHGIRWVAPARDW